MSNTYRNPILPGFNPDPSLCHVPGVGFFASTSTFEFFPGLPIYHSTDAVNWKVSTVDCTVLELMAAHWTCHQPTESGGRVSHARDLGWALGSHLPILQQALVYDMFLLLPAACSGERCSCFCGTCLTAGRQTGHYLSWILRLDR